MSAAIFTNALKITSPDLLGALNAVVFSAMRFVLISFLLFSTGLRYNDERVSPVPQHLPAISTKCT
ncbi:hypothetical protein J4731_10795 [Providencia rettgeri]|nr:hypothetical protein [Providencia rettgeri]